MKKTTVFILALFTCLSGFSQTGLPKLDKDTIFTTSGYKIIAGEEIRLGAGTMPNGDFKFIHVSRKSPFNNGRNFNASLDRSSSGHVYKVAKVVDYGSSKAGYTYYALISLGPMRYEIDIENAIASGEIAVPNEFKKTTPTTTSGSTADELIKLKKLLDDGVITKEEFEKQKSKLLNQ
ncbi:MAG: SHOCT domain-containing protein [Filimonas sp.]|nr:SHOCT domain-containing protein [Filimonas sp.]